MLFSNSRQLLDSLLWGSMVGYPSDSLAFCCTFMYGHSMAYSIANSVF